jgi:5'-nucleotidase
VKGIPVLKSGTDFRDFSAISVSFDSTTKKPKFNIERISVTSDYEEDASLKSELDIYTREEIYHN